MFKKILTSAFLSPFTTIFGSIAGIPEFLEGYNSKDWCKAAQGLALLFLGVFSIENKNDKK